MNLMEKFNHNLNNSLLDNNSEMEDFKEQVDLLLKTVFEQLDSTKSALIIGAGKMNDFSLNFFAKYFDEVLLTDIDPVTVNHALNQSGLTKKEREKIRLRQVDFSGYEDIQFFHQFKERLMTCRTFEKIDQVLKTQINSIKNYTFLADEKSFDFIYVSPIYTQLVYNQVLYECSILRENGYPEHLIKYVESILLDEMVDVINMFNSNVIRLLHDEGKLVVLSDIFQTDIGSSFHLRVKNGIRNFDVMEEIYAGYQKKFGMGLGDYGLYNLDEQLKPTLSRWLIWPFDQKSTFVVKLKIYQKQMEIKEESL